MGDGRRTGTAGDRAVRRRRRRRLRLLRTVSVLVLAIVALAGWVGLRADRPTAAGTSPAPSPVTSAGAAAAAAGSAIPGAGSPADPPPASTTSPATDPALPLRSATLAKLPAGSTQVVVVEGEGPSSSRAKVRYFERRTGWVEVASWSGHVGRSGWTSHHVEGDLRTPTGVYTLTDAGGRLADPGTQLSYERSTLYRAPHSGPGFGDSAADAFDYVIAIDYNRVPGKSPLDYTRPLGTERGGGIWLHVDHDGPTHGCVSVPRSAMRLLLSRLDPSAHPVVVMGPRQSL